MKDFLEKHPKAAQWIREGGLFVLFSYVVTFIKYLLLTFLPGFFHGIVGDVEWVLARHQNNDVRCSFYTGSNWNPVTAAIGIPDAVRNIVTTIATGGVAMVIIFAIDKTIFAPGFGEKKKL